MRWASKQRHDPPGRLLVSFLIASSHPRPQVRGDPEI